MKKKEKTKREFFEAIEVLKKKIIECEKLESQLKDQGQAEAKLEEMAELRVASERIVNKQLRHEIDQRRALEAELYSNQQFLEAVFNGITEEICVVSKDFKILWANKTFLDQFHGTAQEVIGRSCHAVTHHQDVPCQPPYDVCPIASVLETGKPISVVHTHFGRDGKYFSEVTAYPIKDSHGEIIKFVHIARDVTSQKKTEEELKQLSVTDPLTGLYNRRGFLLLAQQHMKVVKRHKQDIGLLFADLDGLKRINDTFGHAQGDAALREVGVLLMQSFRESDVIARIGGDEFVVLTLQTGKAAADALTAGLRKRLEERNSRPGQPYALKISFGVAYCDPGALCVVEDLLSRADKAMYQKKCGRPQEDK